jgi:hypothetical protein
MHTSEFEGADGTGDDSAGEARLRPDERRRQTDVAFRQLAQAEAEARRQKTEKLRRARLENSEDGI